MAEFAADSPPQKLSRYRSQRRQAQQTADQTQVQSPASQQDDTTTEDSVARSKSRYRRKASVSERNLQPATASDQDQISVPSRSRTDRQSSGRQYGHHQTQPTVTSQSQRLPDRHASPPVQLGASDARAAWGEEEQEEERMQHTSSPNRTYHSPQSPSGELFPPIQLQPVKPSPRPVQVDGPPTSDQIRATKSTSALPKYSSDDDDDDDDDGGCFGFFKKRRGGSARQGGDPVISHPLGGQEYSTIKPGGGGVVPGIDAPKSAVNAGDRTVLVEYGKSKVILPVTPTTTPVDIMKSAATSLSERIDLKSAVLLESFSTVGIQRPLRRYEHIRDVMNSWDTDRQNRLILVDPGTGSSEAELSVSGAPQEKPREESWFVSFSQKPGKWDKRLITLREDGQITAQKDVDKTKDLTSICHLSDFDIYTPTQEKTRRKIKPPKKICFAIKSQQKTSMFESTHNFVHFFCTNDKGIADHFYSSVQGWRSWYLINVLGAGQKTKSTDADGHAAARNHRPGEYVKPTMDTDHLHNRSGTKKSKEDEAGFTKSSNQFDTTISPELRTSGTQKKQWPPGPKGNRTQLAEDEPLVNLARQTSNRRTPDKRRPSTDQSRQDDFLATGLLGRTYSQRQRQHEREHTTGYEDEARRSVDGIPRRTHSQRVQNTATRSTSNTDLQRSTSRGHRPNSNHDLTRSTSRGGGGPTRPLVDLTPQYREPPQHTRRGRGYRPEDVAVGGGGGPLIDSATSPDDPIGAPSSTDWRGGPRNPSHTRATSLTRAAKSTRRPPPASRENSGAFTGEGQQQGGGRPPLVELNERSQFAQGSLLGRVEQQGS